LGQAAKDDPSNDKHAERHARPDDARRSGSLIEPGTLDPRTGPRATPSAALNDGDGRVGRPRGRGRAQGRDPKWGDGGCLPWSGAGYTSAYAPYAARCRP
ncbi:MAG: hypothetical protein LH630_03585, partial [Actinomycetia bacterium]|nr:hypothetical protein [Actinomycetes bacterium]